MKACCCDRNSKAGDVDVLQHMLAKYLLEASIVEYDMVNYSPSIMAAAALYFSLLLLEPGKKEFFTIVLENLT